MKILVIGDLHGRKPIVHFKDFDCIAMVGDIASDKKISPYIRKWFRYLKEHPEESLSLSEYFKKFVKNENLKKLEKESLETGNRILKQLDKYNKPIFLTPGNWDESYGPTRIKDMDKNTYNYLKAFLDFYQSRKINKKLIKGVKNIRDCQNNLHSWDGVNFIGYGLSSNRENPKAKRGSKKKRKMNKENIEKLYRAYKKILQILSKEYQKRNKKSPTIFISHNMPHGILDTSLDKKSYAYKKHLGSDISRSFCLKYKPLICLGGHLHEHYGRKKLGKTTCINAGFGSHAQVLIDLDEKKGKIRKIQFYKKYKKPI